MSPFAIQLSEVRKDFAGEKALKGLSLQIPKKSLFGLIGADGAGKTTLMRILATLLDADSGSVSLLASNPRTEFTALRKRIGYMPQRFSLYTDLSVQENMKFFATLFGLTRLETESRMHALLKFANLTEFIDRRAGALSGGMKQKLALSCILLHEPELLLLDEPTVGVDPVARRDFWKLLKTLRDEGRTIIVSTPYMDEAELCSSLALMHQGELLALGKPETLTDLYPLPMLSIRSEAALRWPLSKPCPPKFKAIYPMGGELHAVFNEPMNHGELATQIKTKVHEIELELGIPVMASIVKPGIEDVFLGLLSGAIDKSLYLKTVTEAASEAIAV